MHVPVAGEQVTAAVLGDPGDDAVDRRADGRPSFAQGAIEFGGPKVELNARRLEEDHVLEAAPDRVATLIAMQTLEDLCDHDSAGADVVVPRQQLGERVGRL